MKHLDKCVNVIPVIAKADTLTLEEREAFKKRVNYDKIYTNWKSSQYQSQGGGYLIFHILTFNIIRLAKLNNTEIYLDSLNFSQTAFQK